MANGTPGSVRNIRRPAGQHAASLQEVQQILVNAVLTSPKDYASRKCEACGFTQFDRVLILKTVPFTHPANPTGEPFEVALSASACRKCGKLIDSRLED